ncbi:phage holin family protein [Terribacillus saccharophilus]|uniref:Holin n=1 Tax=Terribacillus saccharophilus TaxID=361277 RepID=A0ABX4GTE6_9BACI|nr:phage holin family protein [Terribacillus saccharophilus]PAD94386.1 hypothetical protein CHH50_18880 [Terribacillus saccharophilus]PAD98134.1 hypothetical protein CHH48_18995 [Terribacillus saccharophilus]
MYLNSIVIDALPLSPEHIAYLTAVFRYFFGDGKFLDILFWACLIDIAAGWMKAIKLGNFKSHFNFIGITKKVGIFFLVVVAVFLDTVLSTNGVIYTGVVLCLIANELASVLENLALLGVPIPDFVTKRLGVLKDQAQNEGTKDQDTM